MAVERTAAGFPPNITALTTTRIGGASEAPWHSFNLAFHVGDDAQSVARNRQALQSCLPADVRVAWLEQVHGVKVIDAACDPGVAADASVCRQPGVACAVLTADCLPVLLSHRAGGVVAAAHAGWRGLAGGVLEATLVAMKTAPTDVVAWLGPCIGPDVFEVGPEVFARFCDTASGSALAVVQACFRPSSRPQHFLADLQALARQRLTSLGVACIASDPRCTLTTAASFFSYRRDGETGRSASLILINP